MKKKQNKSSSKRIKNIVSAALLASICLSLTAFTPAESKNTVLASIKTSKSKEGSTAWGNLLPKDAKKNSDTVTELDVIIYMEIFFIIIAFTEYFFMKIV